MSAVARTDIHDIPRARVLLASRFPADFVRSTTDKLAEIGVDVVREVDVEFTGDLSAYDAVAFMFQMCSHNHYFAFKKRADRVKIPFVPLSRKVVGWAATFRLHGVRLPIVSVADVGRVVPAPSALVVPPTLERTFETFGQALRAARAEEEVSCEFIAELCGVTVSDVEAWEADRGSIDVDAYDKLTELFDCLSTAPTPQIRRRTTPKLPPTPSTTPIPAPPSNVLVFQAPAPRSAPSPAAAALPPAPPPETVREPAVQPPAPVVPEPALAPPPPTPAPAPEKPAAPAVCAMHGLLAAARALGTEGPIHLIVDDGRAEIVVGEESWAGKHSEEAIAQARTALDGRLDSLLRKLTAARQLLGTA